MSISKTHKCILSIQTKTTMFLLLPSSGLWMVLLALGSKVDQLRARLQMGYDATAEARQAMEQQDYTTAAASLTDALNLGRKPALALHEIMSNDSDNKIDNDGEALTWLVDVCCSLAELNLHHLNNAMQARADAWAACLFSEYTQRRPLELMKAVCVQQEDLLGELQACKQLLNLPKKEFLSPESDERQAIVDRLVEIEKQLAPKLKQ